MTSDETIRKAAEVLTAHPSIPNDRQDLTDREYVCPTCGAVALVYGPNSPDHALHQAEQLAKAGLLAPAPLREEWGAEMYHPIPDRSPSTIKARDLENARWQVEHNPKVATGRIMPRYVSGWEEA